MEKSQWFAMMFSAFTKWVEQRKSTFRIEEFRSDMAAKDYPMPVHANHWGSLTKAAKQIGLIDQVGWDIAKQPGQHGNIVRLWKARGV